MKVVYVAGPFRANTRWGVVQNIRRAEEMALEVALRGAMPLCPHTNTSNFDGLISDVFWLRGTLELLRRCDAVMVCAGWQGSTGTAAEIEEAKSRSMPVFYRLEDLMAWLQVTEGAS